MDKENKNTDTRRARRFANTFRFIDDLRTVTYGDEFERSFKEIYPSELEPKKKNHINAEVSF